MDKQLTAPRQEVVFEIIDQRHDNSLNVYNRENGTYFVMSAFKLACNLDMLSKFSARDACTIGFMAHTD